MKKKGSKCDYIAERNKNLRREFLARLGRNGRKLDDIFTELAGVGADRFYISEEQAVRLIHNSEFIMHNYGEEARNPETRIRKGGYNRRRQLMVAEIARRVRELRSQSPGMQLKEAVFRVVNSPAPSFYISPSTIKTIIYRA